VRAHVTGLPLSSVCCMAMWTMKRFGAAPCQWFSGGPEARTGDVFEVRREWPG
jgi:hypothetical protein